MAHGEEMQSAGVKDTLAAFQCGDELFFARLVHEYSPRLRGLGRRFASDMDELDDIVQETWYRAYEHRDQLRDITAFPHWLLRICHNVCLKSQRSTLRKLHCCGQLLSFMKAAAPEMTPAAVDAVEDEEAMRCVMVACAVHLSERQRAMLFARVCAGYSTAQVATSFGCAEATVRATIFHAVRRIRSALDCEGERFGPIQTMMASCPSLARRSATIPDVPVPKLAYHGLPRAMTHSHLQPLQ